jgi:hypothetical protein
MCSALLGRIYEEALLLNMNGAEDMRLKQAKGMLDNTGGNSVADAKSHDGEITARTGQN